MRKQTHCKLKSNKIIRQKNDIISQNYNILYCVVISGPFRAVNVV